MAVITYADAAFWLPRPEAQVFIQKIRLYQKSPRVLRLFADYIDMFWKPSILAFYLLLSWTPVFALPQIVRGPYLQKASSTGVIVRWRTDSSDESVVRYGLTLDNLEFSATTAGLATEHRVELTGLSPDTLYYYAVGSNTHFVAGPQQEIFFQTSPLSRATRPVRVWVIGDSGKDVDGQLAVLAGYLSYATRTKKADLWLMLGDNAYSSGLDSEYQSRLFDVYRTILANTVLWPTFGNHDGASSKSRSLSGPYYDSFSLPRNAEAGGVASGTEAYYSFDYGPIHFICLNSYDIDRSASASMASWLTQDLAATTAKWRIAYWHHPPYSKGSHDSDIDIELQEMRENIVPLLEDGGVDLVLTGHSHSYERSFLLDGHYGLSTDLRESMVVSRKSGSLELGEAYTKPANSLAHRGTVYVVAGNGSLIEGGSFDHPAMYSSERQLGSLVLDIEGNTLTSRLITPEGNVDDSFVIQKNCYDEGPCPLLPSGEVFPTSEKQETGHRKGSYRNLTTIDGKIERLTAGRLVKNGKSFGFSDVWNFQIPAGRGVTTVKLVARGGAPLRLSYSFDGNTFVDIAESVISSKRFQAIEFSFPYQFTNSVFLKISSVPSGQPSDRKHSVKLDSLSLY